MRKAFLNAFLIALMLSGLALVSSAHFGRAQSVINTGGTISSDTMWTQDNSPYTLTGNLLVSNGATLTIAAGATVNLDNYYIMVNGTLVVLGSNYRSIYISEGQIIFTQFSTGWSELTGTGCIIENATLYQTSISDTNSLNINNDYITGGITVASSSAISNSAITGDVDGGLILGNTINGEVSGSTILNNTITGGVVGNVISNNIIVGGITASGNDVISNNTITGGLPNSGNGIFLSSQFLGSSGFPVIQNNVIENVTVGVCTNVFVEALFSVNIPLVQNNIIAENSVGIEFSIYTSELNATVASTSIQNNTIANNGVGIELTGSPLTCIIQYNNIEANSNYSLYLSSPDNVNATYNWWGTNDADAINQTVDFTSGTVTFAPFLIAPNTQASPNPNAPNPTPAPVSTPSPTPSPTPTPTLPPEPSASPTANPSLTSTAPSVASVQQPTLLFPVELTVVAMAIVILAVAIVAFMLGKKAERNSPHAADFQI